MILPRIILGMVSTNERRCYNVTSSLIGWAHTQTDPCFTIIMLFYIIDCHVMWVYIDWDICLDPVVNIYYCNTAGLWYCNGIYNVRPTGPWFYSENARVCAKWQWNARDCVTGLHDPRSRECNPVTPVECVLLSFRTHPCVLAFITNIFCTNGIEMAFG